MMVIADSGSTKTTWAFIEDGKLMHTSSGIGINPFFQTEKEIREEGRNVLNGLPVDNLYFYGAGCTPEKSVVVKEALQSILPQTKIEVESDLLGAARSLCGREPGIACIMGTGSNSCFFDGDKIAARVPALGFILGDEGSGAYLGKRLLGDLLKNQLPASLKEELFATYQLTEADIIDKVYRQPFPNRFLASLSPFLAKHKDNSDVRLLIADSFRSFLERNVMQYDYRNLPAHFVGSVAYFYSDILKDVAGHLGIQTGTIVQSPIEGLIHYHSI